MVSRRKNTAKPNPKPKPSPILSRRRRSSESPSSVPSLVVASIDKSLRTCRRRLIKIFARLTLSPNLSVSTPKRGKHGFRRLHSVAVHDDTAPIPPLLLPPTNKRTLFLDLDETLVHSSTTAPERYGYDFTVTPLIENRSLTFYVSKRPGVDAFLEEAARRFEVVVFTAGLEEYASLVLDRLDLGRRLFAHRLYRTACREVDGKLVKDLAATGRALDKVVIVDDNPGVYSLQPENAVPVGAFTGDVGDRELRRVTKFFEVAEKVADMRDAVRDFLKLSGGNAVEGRKEMVPVPAAGVATAALEPPSTFVAVSA